MRSLKIIKRLLCVISMLILCACDDEVQTNDLPKNTINTTNNSYVAYDENANTGNNNTEDSYRETSILKSIDLSPDSVKSIIASGADVNERDEYGRNVLHKISSNTDPEVVKMLIDAGVNVNAKTSSNMTPLLSLCYSVKEPNLKILELLINAGADMNATWSVSHSALTYLIQYKNLEAIKLFASKGANLRVRDPLGKTLLHDAVLSGDIEIINFLITHGVPVDEARWKTPLMVAIEENASLEVITTLLEHKADPNLFFTNRGGYEQPYKFKRSKDPNEYSVLELALKHKRDETVIRTLLKYGAKVTVKAIDNAAYLKNTQLYWQMRDVVPGGYIERYNGLY